MRREFSFVRPAISRPFAGYTAAARVLTLSWIHTHVIARQWVSVLAKAFSRQCAVCDKKGSLNVYFVGNCFQMDWIDTLTAFTKMIAFQSLTNWSNKHQVHKAMHEPTTRARRELCIPILTVSGGGPIPTRNAFVGMFS